jgi:hypothetical protein
VKRVVLIVIGVILLVGGALTAVAGGALMAAFGSNSTLTSGPHRVSTPTSALVAAMDDIKDTNGVATTVGRPRLRVSLTGAGRDVFIGVGPAAAVDSYLSGAAIDKVTDLDVDPFRLTTARQNGTAQPAPPGAQTFWTARDSGPSVSIDWKVSDGSYRLVLMNVDAAPDAAADGRFALEIPHVFPIGIGLLAAGCVVALIGVLLLVIGARTRRVPQASANGGYSSVSNSR